jgi:hypothetical protein
MAHVIVVNSKFTCQVFKESFPTITRIPEVLYPCIDVEQDLNGVEFKDDLLNPLKT